MEIPFIDIDVILEKSFKLYLSNDLKYQVKYFDKEEAKFNKELHLDSNGRVTKEFLEKEDNNTSITGVISSLQSRVIEYNVDFDIINNIISNESALNTNIDMLTE